MRKRATKNWVNHCNALVVVNSTGRCHSRYRPIEHAKNATATGKRNRHLLINFESMFYNFQHYAFALPPYLDGVIPCPAVRSQSRLAASSRPGFQGKLYILATSMRGNSRQNASHIFIRVTILIGSYYGSAEEGIFLACSASLVIGLLATVCDTMGLESL